MHKIKPQAIKVYEIKPEDFKTKVQVSACYVDVNRHLLLLQCSPSKPEADKWGVPAGKLEANELPEEAAKRELFEESGIEIQNSDLQSIGTLYIRKPEIDFVYHLFSVSLPLKPKILLSNEHLAYMWATKQDLENLPLITGAKEAFSKYRTFLAKKRIIASVNAFLVLRKNNQILLMLRKNTGFLDNHWGLVSGHVEPNESATEGIIREAKEELGIDIHPNELKVVHVMHRRTDRLNIDVFFECYQWQGEISNQEPDKCGGIRFFSFELFPSNTIDYNIFALNLIAQKKIYSEWGFS